MFKPVYNKITCKDELNEVFDLINFHAAIMKMADSRKSIKLHHRAVVVYLKLVRDYYVRIRKE